MHRPPKTSKLADWRTGYALVIGCKTCKHARRTEPHSLAKLLGWDVPLRGERPSALLQLLCQGLRHPGRPSATTAKRSQKTSLELRRGRKLASDTALAAPCPDVIRGRSRCAITIQSTISSSTTGARA